MGNMLRKHYPGSDGELFQLHAGIREVRREERREQFMADFRELLRKVQEVKLIIRKGSDYGTVR